MTNINFPIDIWSVYKKEKSSSFLTVSKTCIITKPFRAHCDWMIWGGGPGGVNLPAETYEYLNLCGRQGKKNPAWKKNFWYLMLENDLSFFPMVFEF